LWAVAAVVMRIWQGTLLREHKIQLEVERKVNGDKVHTACGVAWYGLEGGGGLVQLSRDGRVQRAEKLATKIYSIN
jgi:hypothetical protein